MVSEDMFSILTVIGIHVGIIQYFPKVLPDTGFY